MRVQPSTIPDERVYRNAVTILKRMVREDLDALSHTSAPLLGAHSRPYPCARLSTSSLKLLLFCRSRPNHPPKLSKRQMIAIPKPHGPIPWVIREPIFPIRLCVLQRVILSERVGGEAIVVEAIGLDDEQHQCLQFSRKVLSDV